MKEILKIYHILGAFALSLVISGCSTTIDSSPGLSMHSAAVSRPGKLPTSHAPERVGGGGVQVAANWCWAACAQDILQQVGVQVSQAQIAATFTGWAQDRPAYPEEVAGILNVYGLHAWVVHRPASAQELYGTLSNGFKIIALISPYGRAEGHFVVVESQEYNGTIIVYDPATGRTEAYPNVMLYISHWEAAVVVGA